MGTEACREEMKMKVTFGAWGFIIGAAVAMIIGFNWGGWTTSGTTQKMSQEAVSASQVASQAAICVAQFMKDPQYKEQLQALQKLDRWEGSKIIEKGGWDKMPGQKEAVYGVASACAEGMQTLVSMK